MLCSLLTSGKAAQAMSRSTKLASRQGRACSELRMSRLTAGFSTPDCLAAHALTVGVVRIDREPAFLIGSMISPVPATGVSQGELGSTSSTAVASDLPACCPFFR